MELESYIERQEEWSERTFGPGLHTRGVLEHIFSEMLEVFDNPYNLSEWIDIVILALNGASRAGYSPAEIAEALQAKQDINMARTWPPPGSQGKIEHIRDKVDYVKET